MALLVLNMGYLFDGTFRTLGAYSFQSGLMRGDDADATNEHPPSRNRFAGTWLGSLPVPLPEAFVQGLDMQRHDFEGGRRSYLRGEWADHGWWYFYLYALLVKEPLGGLCLAALAVVATVFLPAFRAGWRDEILLISIFLAVVGFVSSQSGFSMHSYHILPALPFLYLWASKVGRIFDKRRAAGLCSLLPAVTIIVLLFWTVCSSLIVYPHVLSHFNELAVVLPTSKDASYPTPVPSTERRALATALCAGPRNGPRHLLGSNIDCGQDLFFLEDWCESHPKASPISVSYDGGYPLALTKIKSAGFPPRLQSIGRRVGDERKPGNLGPRPGWYALSVNEIYRPSGEYRYFLYFEPEAMAGYSIYIYHINSDEAEKVRRKLGLPDLDGG
jgi:hypothetical protein